MEYLRGLIDVKQWDFRAGRGCVDQIFTLKQTSGKKIVYVGLIGLEMAYDKVIREALWQVLIMYDVGNKLLSGIRSMYVDS